MEEWRKVSGYPGYFVSNRGRVRNAQGFVLKVRYGVRGLGRVELYKAGKYKNFRVCDLVAQAYLVPQKGKFLNFRDGDRTNNAADNLVYLDTDHYMRRGPAGKRVRIVETGHVYEMVKDVAEAFGASRGTVAYALAYPHRTFFGLHLEYLED